MNKILWSPEAKNSQTEIKRYLNFLSSELNQAPEDARSLYEWSIEKPEQFWSSYLKFSNIVLHEDGGPVLKDKNAMPGARWFPEHRLNFAENLLQAAETNPDKKALLFRSEDQVTRDVSYGELHQSVAALAAHWRRKGIVAEDRVAAVTPNCPEAITAMLAASSIGAVWSSCSPDFGPQGVLDRFGQIEPRVLVVSDGYYYKGKYIDILPKISEILAALPSIEEVIVFSLDETAANKAEFTCTNWNQIQTDLAGSSLVFESLPFNHPLYILFSSGTTGKPKCMVHGAGGTLLEHSKELRLHTDVTADDVFFYATTCGWMMWNWLVSSLHCGATLVLYDGFPLLDDGRVLFNLVEETKMTVFGTSAGFLSAIEKTGITPRAVSDLSTLRAVLSTGSVLPPESFDFVYEKISPDVLLASVSGGTDIVGCFALGCPALPVRRGELQTRSFGYAVEVFNEAGESLCGEKGELVCTAPFPSMPIYFWNDPDNNRYKKAYFNKFPGVWRHGDYVELTEEGGMIFFGRSDAVLNPGGVRIGTAEIYRQVEQFAEVVASVVVGHQLESDEEVVLFLKCREGFTADNDFLNSLKKHIRENASPRHVPRYIFQVSDIPVTRSGKISELSVKKLIHGEPVENKEALANPESLDLFSPKLFL